MRQDRVNKYQELRQTYPEFVYESFTTEVTKHGLRIRFHFSIPPDHHFFPLMEIENKDFVDTEIIDGDSIQNLAFHIGLAESVSYWKATCSPIFVVKPFRMNEEQITWWKKLFFHGLGEFFYLNGLAPDPDSFMQIVSHSNKDSKPFHTADTHGLIIPVGGGKDSVVSLELLRKLYPSVHPMIVNPRGASLSTASTAGYSTNEILCINRSICPQLLKLNEQGFLNGHTPFSALLAFISLLAGAVTGTARIALSNEASADEPTVRQTDINHQYSKSFGFEKDFRDYAAKYISDSPKYFSFLRPLQEIQIAGIFSQFPQYFDGFKSCNAGSKTDIWCGKCAKCLFTYVILSPFLTSTTLERIFGKNLFMDHSLSSILQELTGQADIKPFECVGTREEVNLALYQCIRNYKDNPLPVLLKEYMNSTHFASYSKMDISLFMKDISDEHFLDTHELEMLKRHLHA